ncbi:Uma2 family endonuclease [soil metagenome]
MSVTTAPPIFETVAELLAHLGDIPPERVRLHPAPGTATEEDVIRVEAKENRLCELVDGTLVEKAMGFLESLLTVELIVVLGGFVKQHNLGVVAGADGTIKLAPGLVRIPDISFISWDRLPDRKVPREPIPHLAIDLAVEVLSKSNTRKEMERKCLEYFEAGARLVWYIDPKTRTAQVYTAPDQSTVLSDAQTLDGGDVLPGFAVLLQELFDRVERGPDA